MSSTEVRALPLPLITAYQSKDTPAEKVTFLLTLIGLPEDTARHLAYHRCGDLEAFCRYLHQSLPHPDHHRVEFHRHLSIKEVAAHLADDTKHLAERVVHAIEEAMHVGTNNMPMSVAELIAARADLHLAFAEDSYLVGSPTNLDRVPWTSPS